MSCPCELPGSGDKVYECERLKRTMTLDWCQLYLTRENYKRGWDKEAVEGSTEAAVELPPIREQVVGFMTSLARFASDGFRRVDKQEFERRVDICVACKFFIRRRGKSGRCKKCGCYSKLKARGRIWTCPEDKW